VIPLSIEAKFGHSLPREDPSSHIACAIACTVFSASSARKSAPLCPPARFAFGGRRGPWTMPRHCAQNRPKS
jgi:hypothetical protein